MSTFGAKILIVDDHPLIREGLIARIRTQPDLVVCGEADNLDDALIQIKATNPDLVIVDISLKGESGLELTKQIKSRGNRPRVLISSVCDDMLYAERAIQAGALGYINKHEAPEQLLDAIRQVLAGSIYLSPEVSQRVLRRNMHNERVVAESPVSVLSDRELEVFSLIGQGQMSRQIADTLSVSIKTVETHRENIKSKLGIRNAAQLARSAVQWSLEGSITLPQSDAADQVIESN